MNDLASSHTSTLARCQTQEEREVQEYLGRLFVRLGEVMGCVSSILQTIEMNLTVRTP